ncbi:uncharacterized protein [Parasteatoda tepidariorum]|uniref:uncharacterized protein n=1 Tax=Parasteatoda tepidariorum TaxID=114398 RepID=UPI00077F9B3D|nr:uncharacterized protein LOC107452606 [Parasteatoda tepidariorum]
MQASFIVRKICSSIYDEHSWLKAFILVSTIVSSSSGLDCFKCVSVGGDNQPCEDPFHNNYTKDILEAPCWAGRKQRDGVFPATACIKLSGIYEDSGEKMIVRGCALDSGTLTIDTEIVRMSHCGGFYFDNRYVSGCLQSCSEDACNSSTILRISLFFYVIYLFLYFKLVKD